MGVIRLDAIMTSSIDAFLETLETPNVDTDIYTTDNRTGKKKISRRGGRVPLDSVVRFRRILPDAASFFLYDSLTLFQYRLNLDGMSAAAEISLSCYGNEENRLRNCERPYTKAFRHPKSGLHYVSLTSATFFEILCDKMGAATYCFILYTSSMTDPLLPCSRHICERAVNDCKEKRDETCETDSDRT